MLKERIYLFLGGFLVGTGSYMIHPGFGIMVIGFVCLVNSYLLYDERIYGNKNNEEANTESGDR